MSIQLRSVDKEACLQKRMFASNLEARVAVLSKRSHGLHQEAGVDCLAERVESLFRQGCTLQSHVVVACDTMRCSDVTVDERWRVVAEV